MLLEQPRRFAGDLQDSALLRAGNGKQKAIDIVVGLHGAPCGQRTLYACPS
jgi:hypothetical protein